jgi:hypothetical protein
MPGLDPLLSFPVEYPVRKECVHERYFGRKQADLICRLC